MTYKEERGKDKPRGQERDRQGEKQRDRREMGSRERRVKSERSDMKHSLFSITNLLSFTWENTFMLSLNV
jgi:hypothetical protein